jgi:hypothetical protein
VVTDRIRVGELYAAIDSSDFELLNRHEWRVLSGYAVTTIDGQLTSMHRLILGLTDHSVVCDHIDRDKLNNRRSNLRVVTRVVNAGNTDKRASNAQRHRQGKFGNRLRLRLRDERERHGWSQVALAEMVTRSGVVCHTSTIAKIESGFRAVRVEELKIFADLFMTDFGPTTEGGVDAGPKLPGRA